MEWKLKHYHGDLKGNNTLTYSLNPDSISKTETMKGSLLFSFTEEKGKQNSWKFELSGNSKDISDPISGKAKLASILEEMAKHLRDEKDSPVIPGVL